MGGACLSYAVSCILHLGQQVAELLECQMMIIVLSYITLCYILIQIPHATTLPMGNRQNNYKY